MRVPRPFTVLRACHSASVSYRVNDTRGGVTCNIYVTLCGFYALHICHSTGAVAGGGGERPPARGGAPRPAGCRAESVG
eukprot:1941161-Pyramimonas_sp.AAC.1